ncbi:DUF4157 domain-containing protein [Lutimonas halocynthiae]|uniref:eCIS core domain-containing protein n=1 Tax=Lutimonas halocynthiae TaxID=1446477 RepID=UPI0025B587C5|nr:DUF4157 domain-containing protein [Lutimonas halocynthiae]MDN3643349.1 DUF4157 domain-containing protein [Lutimonas halocynthiae]
MNTHVDRLEEHTRPTGRHESQSVAKVTAQEQGHRESIFQFADNRIETVMQFRVFQDMANNSQQVDQIAQLQEMVNSRSTEPRDCIQKKENNTGLPDHLKSGIESLSGYSMDDVKVHRNSHKPAGLQAYAYTQGTNIHLGPGQEKHLPHEAWHVVQQKQGRVKPTLQMKGNVNVNDDSGLEKEADLMGGQALGKLSTTEVNRLSNTSNNCGESIQFRIIEKTYDNFLNEFKKKIFLKKNKHDEDLNPDFYEILDNIRSVYKARLGGPDRGKQAILLKDKLQKCLESGKKLGHMKMELDTIMEKLKDELPEQVHKTLTNPIELNEYLEKNFPAIDRSKIEKLRSDNAEERFNSDDTKLSIYKAIRRVILSQSITSLGRAILPDKELDSARQIEQVENSAGKGACQVVSDTIKEIAGSGAKVMNVNNIKGADNHSYVVAEYHNTKEKIIVDPTWRQFTKQFEIENWKDCPVVLFGTKKELKTKIVHYGAKNPGFVDDLYKI